MRTKHLQKILCLFAILSTCLWVNKISAEQSNLVTDTHPVNELCKLWTIPYSSGYTYVDFEQKLLSLNLPLSKREILVVAVQCSIFASDEMMREKELRIEKIRQKILELEQRYEKEKSFD